MIEPDVIAEAQVLGMVLNKPATCRDRFLHLGPDAFTSDRHHQIAAVIRERYASDDTIDVPSLQREVSKRTGTDEAARRASFYVFELFELASQVSSLGYYADRVDRIARARRAVDAADAFRRRVENSMIVDDQEEYSRAVSDMATAVEDATASSGGATQPPISLAELLTLDTTHDWLIPGVFERTDRMILTGWEGLGKSELACQFALTAAAGLHPLTGNPLPGGAGPIRVLVVDAENAQRQIARRYRRVRDMVDALRERHRLGPVDWADVVRFVIRPEGIPLSAPRELARLEQNIAACSPDFVVAGPIYKLADQDTRDEQAAKALTATLDKLRQRHQFALLLEAHSGHGGMGPRSVRPTGSSLFLRWPEFGYGIKPAEGCEDEDAPHTVKVVSWRGPREERAWPKWLTRTTHLPWMSADATYSDHLDEFAEAA